MTTKTVFVLRCVDTDSRESYASIAFEHEDAARKEWNKRRAAAKKGNSRTAWAVDEVEVVTTP